MQELLIVYPKHVEKDHGLGLGSQDLTTWVSGDIGKDFRHMVQPSPMAFPWRPRQKHSIFDEETCCRVDVQEPLAIALLEAMNGACHVSGGGINLEKLVF